VKRFLWPGDVRAEYLASERTEKYSDRRERKLIAAGESAQPVSGEKHCERGGGVLRGRARQGGGGVKVNGKRRSSKNRTRRINLLENR